VHHLDRYQAGDSPVHRLDPRVKVGVALLVILSNALLPDGAWPAFLLTFGLVLLAGTVAGLGPWFAVRRSFVALPFALAAVSVIVAMPGQPLAAWAVGPWTLVPTDAGLIRFASIVARSLLSVQAAILLTATTPFPDLLHALRHLRVPPIIVAIIAFMYRYLFVLTDEAARLLRAREARSARPAGGGGGGTVLWRAGVAGHLAGQLFLRGYERSERVHGAMLARGYTGELRTLTSHAMQRADWVCAALAVAAVAAIQIVGRLVGR
jgi:cobalt/nickel transport system permease protein